METLYTAQQIAGTENGWLITTNETKEEDIVFCNLNANTAEDAVAVLKDSKAPRNEQLNA